MIATFVSMLGSVHSSLSRLPPRGEGAVGAAAVALQVGRLRPDNVAVANPELLSGPGLQQVSRSVKAVSNATVDAEAPERNSDALLGPLAESALLALSPIATTGI